jgi:hypothetical protein
MPEVETWASAPSICICNCICISQLTIEHTWTSLSWHMEGANTKKVGVANILSSIFLSYDRAFINHHECLLPGQDVREVVWDKTRTSSPSTWI